MHVARYRVVGGAPTPTPGDRRKELWFKTFAHRSGSCHDCDTLLDPGDPIGYRKRGGMVLCARCVDFRQLTPLPSRRWQAQQQQAAA